MRFEEKIIKNYIFSQPKARKLLFFDEFWNWAEYTNNLKPINEYKLIVTIEKI